MNSRNVSFWAERVETDKKQPNEWDETMNVAWSWALSVASSSSPAVFGLVWTDSPTGKTMDNNLRLQLLQHITTRLRGFGLLGIPPLFTVNLHLLSTRDHWRWPSWLNFHICSTARLYSFILSGSLLWKSENYDCFSLVCRVYCHHQHSNNLIIRGMTFTLASTRRLKCAEALPTAPQIDHIFIVNQD